MKEITFCIIFTIFIGTSFKLFSQEKKVIPTIKVLASNKKKQVKLRWAPDTPIIWQKLNKEGYLIERITVKKEGKLMPPSYDKKILDTIKPKALEEWKTVADNNNYAAMVAQLLYGTIDTKPTTSAIESMFTIKKDLDNRFSFVLLAADMDFETANLAGLGYIDTTVEPKTEYLYRIKNVDPNVNVKTGLKLIHTEKEEVLPPPIDLYALPEDKKITLSWDKEIYKSIYTAYTVEKSEDSLHFKEVNGGLPFVSFSQDETSNKQFFYVDSITVNYKPYYYRVIGISAFGEKSLPSKIVSVKGVEKLTAIPKITSDSLQSSGDLILNWRFNREAEKQIKSFTIDWAPKAEGPYVTIKKNVPNFNRSTIIDKIEASNYYKVNAIGLSNQKTTSLMHFVQQVDSVPPIAPTGLEASIDSLGIVKLSWQANEEKDIRGYIVRRANLRKEKTIPTSTDIIKATTFIDTIQVKSLNASVFYQVVALDNKYNVSKLSKTLEVKKPDIVPPVPPIFETYKVTANGVFLQWINSSSKDVVAHNLYRKELTTNQDQDEWKIIFETDSITAYTDKNIKAGLKYKYAIFAIDANKLQSEPTTPLTITANMVTAGSIIKGFDAYADREEKRITISWRKIPDTVKEVLVYRSKNEGLPMLWRQVPPNTNQLVDARINPDNTYTYTLKTIFAEGTIPQTKSIEVTY
ncbi:hypothetical protein [uncultured Aquimarina sp.]|uniref:hypothetical protein n=1 Tax=uncultured Aquimarina sp. TaxID=575652 RepID=UPI00261F673F|nr:hypothetical protein [uncultured Aquimarina sp.]